MRRIFKVCGQCGQKKRIKESFKNEKSTLCNDCLKKNKEIKRMQTLKQRKQDITKAKNFTGFYLYKFLDKNNNIIYIGKTTNFNKRMSSHFGKENFNEVLLFETKNINEYEVCNKRFNYLLEHHGHLPFECYESVRSVEKAILNNQYEMDILEIHLINKYKSKYNTEYKYDNVNKLFDIKEPRWFKTIDLEHLRDYFLITNASTRLYDLIKDDDEMIDIISKNHHRNLSENELIDLCNNI